MENKRGKNIFLKQFAMLLSCLLFLGCTSGQEDIDHGEMEVIVFGLRRADSVLITTQNHAVMIDTGENRHGQAIVNYLRSQDITSLDYLVITHFDRDHVGGAHHIVDAIDVQTVVVPNYSRESRHIANLQRAMADANLTPVILTEPLRFTLDHAVFVIDPAQIPYFAFGSASDDDDLQDDGNQEGPRANNFSIVISIVHGENAFLFTGDAQSRRMREVLENEEMQRIDFDFLKVPRHGRYMSRSSEFVEAIRPRYAVVTDSYERPADGELLEVLDAIDAHSFFARDVGVHVISDGVDLIVRYSDFFASE